MTRTEEKFNPLFVQPVIVTYRFLMELQSIRVVSLHRSRVLVQLDKLTNILDRSTSSCDESH